MTINAVDIFDIFDKAAHFKDNNQARNMISECSATYFNQTKNDQNT